MTIKVAPSRLQSTLNLMLQSLELPNTNQEEQQSLACDLFIGSMLVSVGNDYKNRAVKTLKSMQDYPEGYDNVVMTAMPFEVSAKVSKARESFDLNEFIKQLSTKHNISITELRSLAAKTTKKSAAPISFKVDLIGDNVVTDDDDDVS